MPNAHGKPTVRETITNIMIDRVEARRAAGENVLAPWRMTWNPAAGMPRNLLTGHPYRGVNIWLTLLSGYSSPFWVPRGQIPKLGATVKMQANGDREPYTPILYWNFPTPEEREEGKFAFCKFYQVWNTEQLSGIEDHPNIVALAESSHKHHRRPHQYAEAKALVNGYIGAPEIRHGGGRACYVPNADRVEMPEMGAFESAEAYYRALFHELTHSTGHRTRLERDGIANPAKFASHAYSEEELIAEMGATMLAGFAGIGSEEADDNSAAYLDHWLRKLKAEPNMLVTAGGAAQKAIDLIRNIKWKKAEE